MKDELLDLLNDLQQYMDDRADTVDGNSGYPVANTEMLFSLRIQEEIIKIENKIAKFSTFIEPIMEYGVICKHDDHFLCEHRTEWIANYFKHNQ